MYIRNISQADLQKVFANKIKRVQACMDARGHHFQKLLQVHSDLQNTPYIQIYGAQLQTSNTLLFCSSRCTSWSLASWRVFLSLPVKGRSEGQKLPSHNVMYMVFRQLVIARTDFLRNGCDAIHSERTGMHLFSVTCKYPLLTVAWVYIH